MHFRSRRRIRSVGHPRRRRCYAERNAITYAVSTGGHDLDMYACADCRRNLLDLDASAKITDE
jgi:hypothetical protein